MQYRIWNFIYLVEPHLHFLKNRTLLALARATRLLRGVRLLIDVLGENTYCIYPHAIQSVHAPAIQKKQIHPPDPKVKSRCLVK